MTFERTQQQQGVLVKRSITITLFPFAIALFVLCASARTASAGEHILVILDTTGSMAGPSIGGSTRLQVAETLLTNQLLGFSDATNEYALWFFDGTDFRVIVPFGTGNATRTTVIAQLATAVPGAATPLAHTICAGVDALAARGTPADVRRIILASDGEENNTAPGPTPPRDQCWGVYTGIGTTFPFALDSWQNRVARKLCTGDANSPGGGIGGCAFLTDLSFVVDVTQIFDFAAVTSAISHGMISEPGNRLSKTAVAPPPPDIDQVFFSTLADLTNGTYVGVTPETPPDEVFLAPGDANHDKCVTLLDRTQVLNDSGTVGNGFDDFNHNGVIDNSDLQVVLQHLGECTPFISVDVPRAIPDNSATGVTSAVSVTSPALHIQTVKVDVDITHTFRGDLVIQVIAPNGQVATLSNRAGGSADNFVATGMDITSLFSAASLTTGTWRLFVRDLAAADVGTINKFRITVTTSI
jgi:hypothetical protein